MGSVMGCFKEPICLYIYGQYRFQASKALAILVSQHDKLLLYDIIAKYHIIHDIMHIIHNRTQMKMLC
jgi:hypothetical protein